jgi:ornithine cyclodeaminase
MKILTFEQIKKLLMRIDLIPIIEKGFVALSQKKAVVPPVAEMLFTNPPGDVHIKYGYIRDDDYYVIKIASGFYKNPQLGIPSSNGLMLIFKQKTGVLESILLDEGYLTNIRTAVAGAVAAKYLAPRKVERIGILGAGIQARLQLEYLKTVVTCRDTVVWGMNEDELEKFKTDMNQSGFNILTTLDTGEVADTCNLIVTATPSTSALLHLDQIRKGTHLTAVGSDTSEKQELDGKILQKADIVVADSIDQCLVRGEIFKAIQGRFIHKEKLIELGDVISGNKSGRTSKEQITIADLTGVAVQDIQVSTAVYGAFNS